MTNQEDKPSILARLAILVTVGVIGWQLYFATFGLIGKYWAMDALTVLVLVPGVFLLGIAGLYYLFKGKPSNADAVIAPLLYRVWGVSVIGGVIFAMILIFAGRVNFSEQFRF